MIDVRRLEVRDAAAWVALRRIALREAPWAFGSSLSDDRMTLSFATGILGDPRHHALFGAFDAQALVGMVGLVRHERAKRAHGADLFGMFVRADVRARGLGRRLLQASIGEAERWGVDRVALSVTSEARSAERLYRACGFEAWGREPRAVRVDGRDLDVIHLWRDLRGAPADVGQGA